MPITIITVSFNAEKTIWQTIESVLKLTHNNNLTYIIIDGKSNDNTVDIIKSYEEKFKIAGINYIWRSEPDQGIYDAMNKGWKIADIDSYIIFLGADDQMLCLPEKFETDIVYGNVQLGDCLFISRKSPRLYFNNTIHHQGLFIRKKIHPSPPFLIKYRMYADFDLNQRLLKSHSSIFHHIPLTIAYSNPHGYSKNGNKMEMVSIVYKNFGWFFASLDYLYLSYHQIKKLIIK